MGLVSLFLVYYSLILVVSLGFLVHGDIPTTQGGPFVPVTVPLDKSFRGKAIDLPHTDTRLQGATYRYQPEQISVSLSYNYDSVYITWITGDFQIGDIETPWDYNFVGSLVQYGTYGMPLLNDASGSSLLYSREYPFEGLQNYTSGLIHRVRLTDLKADTLYQYQCGDPSIGPMSDVHYFKTMPESNRWSYPNRIAIVGDLGLTYNTTSTVDHLMSNHPDLVVLVGDISYADMYLTNGTPSDCYDCSFRDTPIHETYQPRWDYWGRFMQPLVSNVPLMVIEGDHDIELQPDDQAYTAYCARFSVPSQLDECKSLSYLYYSFNAGGIHFVMLDAYFPYDNISKQYLWLDSDLSSVDRSATPWLVAVWHPPWYSTYKAHYREAECMRVELEDILYKYGVDIIFNGHVHAYERSNRVYKYSLNECGPIYISVGDGGNQENMAIEHADEPGNCPVPQEYVDGSCAFNFTSGPAAGKFCWDQQPDYSAYRESSFGHGILEVKNETHALWTWHRNKDSYLNAGDIIYIVRNLECAQVQVEHR